MDGVFIDNLSLASDVTCQSIQKQYGVWHSWEYAHASSYLSCVHGRMTRIYFTTSTRGE
jgi:hypothetical protein